MKGKLKLIAYSVLSIALALLIGYVVFTIKRI